MLTTHNPTKIAALNDAARKSFSGCRVYMTPGVQALYQTQAIAARVQAYDDFNQRNDPYGEHDFGSFEFCGETIFWKIECPSSYKLGHKVGLSYGGSGSSVGLIMQPAFDVCKSAFLIF